MPHKGESTQCHNQQVLAKPCHNPSDRDQQVREKLQQKAKIRSQAYIQLGEERLKSYIEHSNQKYQLFYTYQL